MQSILAISLNTFREAIRNKVLYSLLFFALLIIVGSIAFGALSVHEEIRLTMDLGLAGMSLFSIVIAIFVGVNLVYKELERKTVYSLLPKPIHRFEFILGKYGGLTLTLTAQVLVMSSVLALVLILQGAALNRVIVQAVLLVYFEVLVMTAIAVLFSSFSTPFLSGMFTVGMFVLGRSVPDIRMIADNVEHPALSIALTVIGRLVPNLRYFYVSGSEVNGNHISIHGTFIDWNYVGTAGFYATLYIALTLLLAMYLFSKRDFI